MSTEYRTPDNEKFFRKLPAQRHVADQKNIRMEDTEGLIEEVTNEIKNPHADEEMLDVYMWRLEEFWEAVRQVKVKATCKDEARERAEEKIIEMATELTHRIHKDLDKLSKVDEAPRSKIESGEYYEDDSQ